MLESERVAWKELLEQYKKMRHLWDPKDRHYQNRTKRAQGFDILFEKYHQVDMKGTVAVMKKRLENMRTSYYRERKKVKQSLANGDEEPYQPTLWYYDFLLFLEDPQPYSVQEVKENGESLRFNFNRTQNKIFLEKRSRGRLKRRRESSSSEREVRQGYINIKPMQSSEEEAPRTRQPSQPRRRIYQLLHKQEKFVDLASKIITKKEKDWEIIGKAIGLQLSALEHKQQTIARKLISDVIYFGNLGKLNVESFINVESFVPDSPQPTLEIREQVFYEERSCDDSKA